MWLVWEVLLYMIMQIRNITDISPDMQDNIPVKYPTAYCFKGGMVGNFEEEGAG